MVVHSYLYMNLRLKFGSPRANGAK